MSTCNRCGAETQLDDARLFDTAVAICEVQNHSPANIREHPQGREYRVSDGVTWLVFSPRYSAMAAADIDDSRAGRYQVAFREAALRFVRLFADKPWQLVGRQFSGGGFSVQISLKAGSHYWCHFSTIGPEAATADEILRVMKEAYRGYLAFPDAHEPNRYSRLPKLLKRTAFKSAASMLNPQASHS